MLPMATELAVHTQGTYVAQKLIDHVKTPQELLDVCRAVLPDTVLLLQVRCVAAVRARGVAARPLQPQCRGACTRRARTDALGCIWLPWGLPLAKRLRGPRAPWSASSCAWPH